jgi:hypothetical protein
VLNGAEHLAVAFPETSSLNDSDGTDVRAVNKVTCRNHHAWHQLLQQILSCRPCSARINVCRMASFGFCELRYGMEHVTRNDTAHAI